MHILQKYLLTDTIYFQKAIDIINDIKQHNYNAYIVGGFVRDILIGIKYNDIDIATDAPIGILDTLFSNNCVSINHRYQNIVVKYDSMLFEISSFRYDSFDSTHLGRKCKTIYTTNIELDAIRRDFTICALYYDPLDDKIIDLVNGQNDILLGIIKCIGDSSTRFREDPIRIIRCIRFKCDLTINSNLIWQIEKNTRSSICNSSHLIKYIPTPGIWKEFLKINNICDAWELMLEYGLIQNIIPDYSEIDINKFTHTIPIVKSYPNNVSQLLKICGLMYFIDANKIAHYFKLNKIEKKICNNLELFKKLADITDWIDFVDSIKTIDDANTYLNIIKLHLGEDIVNTYNYQLDKITKCISLKPVDLINYGLTSFNKFNLIIKNSRYIAYKYDIIDKNVLLQKIMDSLQV